MRRESENSGRKVNTIIAAIFIVILTAVLAVVVILAVKKHNDSKEVQAAESGGVSDAQGMEKWQEGTVSYNGKKYRYNTAIKTYLYMGIDHEGPVEEAKDGISGGQSDSLFLLVVDGKKEKMSIVAIHRNSMTDVDVYNTEGDYIDTRKLQICLQHAYGDGMRTSCLRTVDAVSNLFYGIPISGYLSLNMGGVPKLNDAVGGVTVEVMNDLENPGRKVSLKQGETVNLNGDEAYTYIRSRDCNEFDSATLRLERQKQYLTAFMTKAKETAQQNPTSVMRIYNSIEDYIVSNIDFAKLADEALNYEFDASQMYTVPGETVMGETYEEYQVDDDALYEMILDIFYESVD